MPSGVLVLALSLTVWAAPPQRQGLAKSFSLSTGTAQALPGGPQELVPELESLMAEGDRLLARLLAMQESYQTPGVVRTMKPERERLRSTLEPLVKRVTELHLQFDERRRLQETIQIQGVVSGFMGGVLPGDPLGMYNVIKAFADSSHVFRTWFISAQGKLDSEAVAFKAAERLARIHMALTWAAIILSLVCVVALWHARRNARAKAKLETDITRLVAASGSVYQGIGGQHDTAPTAGATPIAKVLGGNYVVERELGRGGMGVVYEATDLSLRRKVAVKKLREELHERVQELETLLAEARLVASLKHPNIVEIHSIFKENGRIFLVFEFVSGRTLAEVVDEQRGLALGQAKGILRQMAAALDYAHGQRVIHRDLKPANVMITADGTVKVMDFGIAHQARVTVAKLTQSEAWGTPPYMAPEQELGKVSKESDIYALGACLYEMLTGRLPFEGPNFLAQKDAMDYKRPSSIRPGIPTGFDAVIARALAPDPAYRFHSAAELSSAVDALPSGA